MNKLTTSTAIPTRALKLEALSNISASFELFCLASGVEALAEMMDQDAQAVCGPRHARGVLTGRPTAGGKRRARSASTAARSRSNDQDFATSQARSRLCRAGRRQLPRTGLASGP